MGQPEFLCAPSPPEFPFLEQWILWSLAPQSWFSQTNLNSFPANRSRCFWDSLSFTKQIFSAVITKQLGVMVIPTPICKKILMKRKICVGNGWKSANLQYWLLSYPYWGWASLNCSWDVPLCISSWAETSQGAEYETNQSEKQERTGSRICQEIKLIKCKLQICSSFSLSGWGRT